MWLSLNNVINFRQTGLICHNAYNNSRGLTDFALLCARWLNQNKKAKILIQTKRNFTFDQLIDTKVHFADTGHSTSVISPIPMRDAL